ncbi:MAG: tetratricopeptide repeat protein [Propionivibrio sp.]|nr:tetratricopeptide repeat protein [Propionivibrio sp.]
MDTFDITHFNPGSQKETDFLAGFIARQNELRFFLAQLRNTQADQTAKHHLIIAPRGYGKTSLLRRIQIALRDDPEFNTHFIPLAFREEQHNVISLDVFWRNCVQSLLEAREDEHAGAAEIDNLDQLWQKLAPRSQLKRDEQDGAPAWTAFSEHCHALGRRPVLLIDNLDTLLAGLERHQWGLRSILQLPDGPILIAAASRYPDSLSDHKAAFFDFFRITNLPALSDHEVMSCLREFARMRGDRGLPVRKMLENDPGRISALNTMAGGNPRTLGVLYTVLEAHMSDDVLAQLSAMLDTFTGWYQARTEELPMQFRAVFDALALNWNPMTAADLGNMTGLDTPSISSHLSRLEKTGYVEAVSLSKTRKTRSGYQVSERFFNIWYLMRNGPRRMRQAIKFLTIFLRSCFNRGELHEMAKGKLAQGYGRVESTLALAACIGDSRLRERLLNTAESCIPQDAQAEEVRALVNELRQAPATKGKRGAKANKDPDMLLLEQGRKFFDQKKFDKAEAAFRQAVTLNDKNARAWWRLGHLLHYRLERYAEAEAAYRKSIALDGKQSAPWGQLGDLLQFHSERYEEAEAAYRQAIALDVVWASPWAALGVLLHYHLQRYEEAEAAYRKAIALDDQLVDVWGELGGLLVQLNRHEEAESAYRQAISLDEKDVRPWGSLGNLLQYHLGRYEEAEQAYRQAIALTSDFAGPWGALGDLLQDRFGRFEEAESAYRQAISLDGKWPNPWGRLGDLLQDHLGRYEEAEAAYRQAIALNEKQIGPWLALGNLYQHHLKRFEEAEAAFRRAIELDDKSGYPWFRLGTLQHLDLGRYEDAESAYRKSIALDAIQAGPWGALGDLLQDHLDRYDEAESAYRQAIALDEQYARAWNSLGNLLRNHSTRYEEAEAAYRQAIALDAKRIDPLNSLGNLLQDYLGRYEDALSIYQQGLAVKPQSRSLLANSAYLCALHLGHLDQAREYAEQAEAGLSPAGQHLLKSMLAWSDGGADAAKRGWVDLHQAVACDDPILWIDYPDDLQRILAYAATRGDGPALLDWMAEAEYPLQFAPLFHAYKAALTDEDHLLSINPEVRGEAEKIFHGLARMLALYKRNQPSPKRKAGPALRSLR